MQDYIRFFNFDVVHLGKIVRESERLCFSISRHTDRCECVANLTKAFENISLPCRIVIQIIAKILREQSTFQPQSQSQLVDERGNYSIKR